MRKASDPKNPSRGNGPRSAYRPTPASLTLLVLAIGIILVFWLVT